MLQADLYRTEQDVERINALGARIRLVKGAYREPKSVAYQKKADVDAAYARLMKLLLADGHYPAIATHDPAMIDLAQQFAAEHDIAAGSLRVPDAVRHPPRPAGGAASREGYRVRVYIPFGRQWFPYFMRRLGERPANVAFVLRGILGEQDRWPSGATQWSSSGSSLPLFPARHASDSPTAQLRSSSAPSDFRHTPSRHVS